MKISSVDSARIDEWIDKHRKMIILCTSFEDAAFIISRDLFGFKTRIPFVIDLIARKLHGGNCPCESITHKVVLGSQPIPIKYDLCRNWNTL